MKRLVLCMLAIGLLIGMSTFASAGVQSGDTTLTVSAAYTYLDMPDYDEINSWAISGRVALGKFFTDNFQLEGIFTGMYGEFIDGEVDGSFGALLVRPNFHFSTQTATVPYLGAAAGIFFVDFEVFDETSFVYGAQAGIKQFVRDNVFVQVEGSFLRTEIESEDINLWRIYMGLGFKM